VTAQRVSRGAGCLPAPVVAKARGQACTRPAVGLPLIISSPGSLLSCGRGLSALWPGCAAVRRTAEFFLKGFQDRLTTQRKEREVNPEYEKSFKPQRSKVRGAGGGET
jgi:hypothetical protein